MKRQKNAKGKGNGNGVELGSIKRKLDPDRFVGMSDKMVAIVGYFLGEWYTDPQITGLCVTSDGMVLAQNSGDLGYNTVIGSYEDLERNWLGLINLEAVGLTQEEREYCKGLLDTMVRTGATR